jgi:hypothetical protein
MCSGKVPKVVSPPFFVSRYWERLRFRTHLEAVDEDQQQDLTHPFAWYGGRSSALSMVDVEHG